MVVLFSHYPYALVLLLIYALYNPVETRRPRSRMIIAVMLWTFRQVFHICLMTATLQPIQALPIFHVMSRIYTVACGIS